jgi:hypothetical protein
MKEKVGRVPISNDQSTLTTATCCLGLTIPLPTSCSSPHPHHLQCPCQHRWHHSSIELVNIRFISLLIISDTRCSKSTYHFLLHLHLLRLLCEFLEDLLDRVNIHACVNLLHDSIDSLEGIDHGLIDFSSRQLHRDCLQLGTHDIVLAYLIPCSH